MAKLEWDKQGERWYETGISKGVLYKIVNGEYQTGVAWNGLTSVSESPEGADANDLWADNIKYATLRAAETFGGTIEAYTYPDEWAECDGSVVPSAGVYVGQQARRAFGLCYRTEQGNDIDSEIDDGYKIHIVYNCTASPSERSYETINDSPDAITFSWEYTSNPVAVTGYKPTSLITIDTARLYKGLSGEQLTAAEAKVAALEDILYGTDSAEARLPMPDEILELFAGE